MRINVILSFFLFFIVVQIVSAQEHWVAPKEAEQLFSPLQSDNPTIDSGRKIFKSLCIACHGDLGKGDGVAAAGLDPKPTDFTSKKFQKQSEGAVFWKLSKGKGVMASYENMLSEKERWQLVAYLKSLKKEKALSIHTEEKPIEAFKKVENTFLFTQLINTQTVHMLKKGTSDFTIQHRFGVTEFSDKFITDFLGMDLSANLRLAFAKAINDKVYVELGRTKYGKVYDLGVKYRFLQQTTDKKIPISMVFYGDVGINSEKFSKIIEGSTFNDGSNFKNKFAHRLSYNTQVIIARKFSDKLSLQLAPVVIWHNLVDAEEKNLDFALPIGGRYALNYKSAILFEVTPKLIAKEKSIPWSLAYEIASSSAHAFQLIVTSTDRILEQGIYSNNTVDYTSGKFVLGFNIKRVF